MAAKNTLKFNGRYSSHSLCSLRPTYYIAGCVYFIQRLSPEGVLTPEEKLLKINIKPGYKNGTKITFPNEGDEEVGITPGTNIHMAIDQYLFFIGLCMTTMHCSSSDHE